jgi:hypothetical protein
MKRFLKVIFLEGDDDVERRLVDHVLVRRPDHGSDVVF